MIDRYDIVAKYFYGMTTSVAKDKQRNFGKCSVSLVKNREIPCLLFAGFWKNSSPQKANFEKCCSMLLTLQDCESCEIHLSTDCDWDSSLVVFLLRLKDEMKNSEIKLDFTNLPPKLSNLLSFSCRNKTSDQQQNQNPGADTFKIHSSPLVVFLQVADYLGKCLIYFQRLLRGKSFMRLRDFLVCCRDCGASALPIVTLISYLTGLTMAFVGSVQLEKFNATIYTADLVCLAMVREMGPLMVAIVMAGRTGASFAAELGSMKLNEELDSLRTLGIPAIDFLVLPRVIALVLMTPMLTLYADIVGILGGLTVGTQIMGFSSLHYFEQTQSALLSMWEISSGLWKSLAFGLIVGFVGCFKGIYAGSSSSSLGRAVTSSVVVSITLIVITDALFEIAYSYFGLR